MNNAQTADVAVIGGGPAGLAAAVAADRTGAKTILIEREPRLGGILKQCIHDGFGLVRFGEKLSGPEYSYRCVEELRKTAVEPRLLSFVTRINKTGVGFSLTLTEGGGLCGIGAKALVLATGCRERTARQAAIHGQRPAGVLTAGTAQYYTNILGQLPCRRCVILGSGDIGLIMARRLYLEGVEVLGVYEAKSAPSGLFRNIAQCLNDFAIPLYTSRTVTRVFGRRRLEGVELAVADEAMQPIPGTEEWIDCDGLILSVGLIPENELAESLGAPIHQATRGPVCDQHYMTAVPGIFCCGNALQVNDLVDYVSESGEIAGRSAALYAAGRNENFAGGECTGGGIAGRSTSGGTAGITGDGGFLCMTPQWLDLDRLEDEVTVFFRAKNERGKTLVRARTSGGGELFSRNYNRLRPPEMERLVLKVKGAGLRGGDWINFTMEETEV
jgi:thioredoxin reductase